MKSDVYNIFKMEQYTYLYSLSYHNFCKIYVSIN